MDLYEKNGKALYVLEILKKYSDEDHKLSSSQIRNKIIEIYNVDLDERTIRRIINLLKYKEELNYDISTRADNGKGYYIYKNPETEFEEGEIRAIIDTFSYSNFIEKSLAENIIKKCKSMQNVYENEKLKDYKIYSNDTKTDNKEVIKNIEDIQNAIYNKNKIEFEYWKYELNPNLVKDKKSKPTVFPYAIIFSLQQFYLVALKNGKNELYTYRIDRMKNINQINTKAIPSNITDKYLNDYIRSNVAMFSGRPRKIVAKCKMSMLDNIIDLFGKSVNIKMQNKNYFIVEMNVDIEGIKYWALRNIREVEIIEPKTLRTEIKEILENEVKKYN